MHTAFFHIIRSQSLAGFLLGVGNKGRISLGEGEDGKGIDIKFFFLYKGRRSVDWNVIEEYLKEYIGKCIEIIETADEIYIGSDFPDEYVHGKDKKILRGANEYAKANASSIIQEMVQIATGKTYADNYAAKHKKDAMKGWYRYDTRFALPIYDDSGVLVKYNVFKARLLVRHDQDGKLYLYDILRIKKETSKPH